MLNAFSRLTVETKEQIYEVSKDTCEKGDFSSPSPHPQPVPGHKHSVQHKK